MTKIFVLGEAWGVEEERAKAPFVGSSGQFLTSMLADAGIDRAACHLTNVFNLHPLGNDIETLCGGKTTALPGYPPLTGKKHVRAEFQTELDRLGDELVSCNPNIVICLGNTALWAMAGRTGISRLRGSTLLSTHSVVGFKLLPTFHPAAVIRQIELRTIVVADLIKAERESHHAGLQRQRREIWIEPDLSDITRFIDRYIRDCRILSVDIETAGNQITCIGFAPSPSIALVVPFLDTRRKGRSYWHTASDERQAWRLCKEVLIDGRIPKLFQNGLYDIAFLWRSAGIAVKGAQHDTMLLHHALQPEMLKGLGFLASVYADEGAWKEMRKKTETIKSDA